MNILGNLSSASVGQPAVSLPENTPRTPPANLRGAAEVVEVERTAVQAMEQGGASRQAQTNGEELNKALEKVSKAVQAYSSELNFSVDEASGEQVVKVMDTVNKKVIRQIPSEEMLKIAENLDKVLGVLFEQKV